MTTERIKSLETTSSTIRHLTEAYQAALLEIVNKSDLHEDGKLCARTSINNDDVLVDVVFEFDQKITELRIEERDNE